MNVEEFTRATEEELRQMAKERLADMEITSGIDKPACLLEAQLYLAELDRREDARVAHRDVVLEIIVIVLIGLEILLGVAGIVISIIEGNQQAGILQKLDDSASDTAKTMRSLSEQQERSVDTQSRTLGTISTMNSAMQNQLDILKKDQRQRLAELAKKPDLRVSIGGVDVLAFIQEPLRPRESSSTKTVFELVITNKGSATAQDSDLKISTDNAGVMLSADVGSYPIPLPSDVAGHAIVIPIKRLVPAEQTVVILTSSYPIGTKAFPIYFGVSGENIPNTKLGGILVRVPLVP